MASMIDQENSTKITPTFIPGTVLRPSTSGNNINLPSFNDIEGIFEVIHNFIDNNLKKCIL